MYVYILPFLIIQSSINLYGIVRKIKALIFNKSMITV